eukprot:jgi/Psemu1/298521/fgenesh1_pm.603_\
MTVGSTAAGSRSCEPNVRTRIGPERTKSETESPESTPETMARDNDNHNDNGNNNDDNDSIVHLEKRLSIDTVTLPVRSSSGNETETETGPMRMAAAEHEHEHEHPPSEEETWHPIGEAAVSPSASPSASPSTTPSPRPLPLQRTNDRLTSIARTAQFWDSNETGIVAAQTAVDRWEDAYVWVRNAVVASSRSVAGIYDASKAGVRGLDRGLLVPVRDYILLPTFGVAEHVVGETSAFLRSSEAERIRTAATKGSSEFVSRAVPFGLGDTVVLPAVRLGAETARTAWEMARYPVPSPKRVRDTVDFFLNGSKHNLSVCGREIRWYVRRADANIGRTLRRTQWVVLGRGPYETLDDAGRRDVMDHVCDRYLSLGKNHHHTLHDHDHDEHEHEHEHEHDMDTEPEGETTTVPLMVARYEFMANVRACNRSLYRDLVETGLLKERGGRSTRDDEWLSERPSYRTRSKDIFLLRGDDEGGTEENPASASAFALWFRLPSENGQKPKRDVPWIAFDQKEGEKLEGKYRSILNETNDAAAAAAARSGANDEQGSCSSRAPTEQQRVEEHEQQQQQQQQASSWGTPKYETDSRWCDPDECADCKAQTQTQAAGGQQPLEPRSEAETADNSSSNGASCKWSAETLLALPPPLLGLHRPTMWRSHGPDEIRRAVWFLDTPQHGPQPYGEDAQALLEDAYHFLKWTIDSKRMKEDLNSNLNNGDDSSSITSSNGSVTGDDKRDENVLLTVQVPSPDNGEQQLVQFSSLTVATAIGRGLGGAIALFKRRVYRGAYHCFQKDDTESTKTDPAAEHMDIDLDYEECFKDVDACQEMEDNAEPSLDENDSPTSTCSKEDLCDEVPSLAFPVESSYSDRIDGDAESPEVEVDHLVLVIHGIGEMMKSFDLFGLKKVPTIVDCCGYLRDNHSEILDARSAQNVPTKDDTAGSKTFGRVEYLPVEWHEAFSIHSTRRPSTDPIYSHANQRKNAVGINDISLRTIPNLRSFANDTLMDILYFMSPAHHDIIIDIVTFELNFIVNRFRTLTGFKGEISIIGHSLGSIVAWDILDHQQYDRGVPQTESTLTKDDDSFRYPQLNFQTDTVFLLGSPIPVFLMIRNQENPLTASFALNGCPKVFNIFHPYDPVSYRIEPLLHPRNAEIEPCIMTHWNGGFRFQYQTKRLWKKLVDQTLRAEENMIHSLESGIQALGLVDSTFSKNSPREDDNDSSHVLFTGSLNGGRRIDYMLQEKEIESANEYVAALAAHSSYWLEKDLSLFIANEICLEKERKQIRNIKL